MKQFLISLLLLCSSSLSAQTYEPYLHEYKKGKSILRYSYIQRNDSSFIVGQLKDRKTGASVPNINILIKEFRIGTVPDLEGNFVLFLPRPEGTIVFDKTGYTYFQFPYTYKKDDLKRPSAHH